MEKQKKRKSRRNGPKPNGLQPDGYARAAENITKATAQKVPLSGAARGAAHHIRIPNDRPFPSAGRVSAPPGGVSLAGNRNYFISTASVKKQETLPAEAVPVTV